MSTLQVIFGISFTTCSDYLKFGVRILLKVLCNNSQAEVQIPSEEKIRSYVQAVETKHPSLKNVWCTKVSIESAIGYEEQARY